MELNNEFVIDRDIEQTWKILNDLEFIAPCMPGAQLTEVEGDEYRGLVKIKVGPITANYKGKASFVEQDAVNKVAKLKAEGRDPRQGNANAMVTAKMEAVSPEQTRVNIHTDLGLSGKLASFGRGAIEDVSKKILGQFTDNLREKLEGGDDTSSTVAETATAAAATATATANDAAASASATANDAADKVTDASHSAADKVADASSAAADKVSNVADKAASKVTSVAEKAASTVSSTASSGVRKINSPEAKPVDVLSVGGTPMLKRALPAVGVLAVLAVLLRWLSRR